MSDLTRRGFMGMIFAGCFAGVARTPESPVDYTYWLRQGPSIPVGECNPLFNGLETHARARSAEIKDGYLDESSRFYYQEVQITGDAPSVEILVFPDWETF